MTIVCLIEACGRQSRPRFVGITIALVRDNFARGPLWEATESHPTDGRRTWPPDTSFWTVFKTAHRFRSEGSTVRQTSSRSRRNYVGAGLEDNPVGFAWYGPRCLVHTGRDPD